MSYLLHQLLDRSAEAFPTHIAVEESASGSMTYAQLAQLSDRVRDRLIHLGVKPGDRVGIMAHKSADTLASLFGIMKAGAAYVPVDPTAPAERNAYIFQNCSVRAVVVEQDYLPRLQAEFAATGFQPHLIAIAGTGAGRPLREALDGLDGVDRAAPTASVRVDSSDLAYILYTSGSTGRPKGVMLSHANAAAFIDWCSSVFAPEHSDRFSSHAPFHFDLSILDIYVSIKHGATLVLVEEGLGKDPVRLAPWISQKRISVWYSVPSILGLMAQFGKLDQHDYSALRLILFAGEVFPIKHLRQLKSLVPGPRYFNLYGPTETNVCTWHEVPRTIPENQAEPVPIGRTCSSCHALVVDADGREVARGREGELCISGGTVMQGYWNLPEQTKNAFLTGRDGRWYRTGDIVVERPDGGFQYLGRRDRMVKKRGFRIELGEIEAALYRHPQVKEAAVVALPSEDGVRIKAFVSTSGGERISIIALKTFCSEHVPLYMVPDVFEQREALPKTSTDKIDYQSLMRA
ncbi:MAG: amino acid adenylation domain-containing protein [Phycisphaerae bacterium]|nr:amino acid adenylation domain-containing protein [Phycisphaerae bacterium]